MNAAVNGVTVETGQNLLAAPPKPFGVTLVGDLFYERPLAEAVLKYIEVAAAGGSLVLIGDPQRNYFPRGRFTQVDKDTCPVTRELEDKRDQANGSVAVGCVERGCSATAAIPDVAVGPDLRKWPSHCTTNEPCGGN